MKTITRKSRTRSLILAVIGFALVAFASLGVLFGVGAVLESGHTKFSGLNYIGGIVFACVSAYLLVPGALSLLAWREEISVLWALLALSPLALVGALLLFSAVMSPLFLVFAIVPVALPGLIGWCYYIERSGAGESGNQ